MSWGIFWSLGALVVSTLGTLLVTPFLIRTLGLADYGLYLLVLSVSSYGGYFDLGLGWAAGRFFARDFADGRRDHLTQRLSSMVAAFLLLGIAAAVLTVSLGPWLLHAAGSHRTDARLCFLLGSVAFVFSLEAGALAALLRGAQRFGAAGAPTALASTLLFAGSYGVVRSGGGVIALLGWGLAVNLVSLFLLSSLSVRLLEHRAEFWLPRMARLLEMGRFGGWMTLSRLAMLGTFQIDRLAVSLFGSVAGLTFYAIPANLASRINVVGGSVANQFLSRVGLLQVQNRWQELADQRSSWRRILIVGTLSIALPIVFLGTRFLGLWISPEMASKGGPILVALSVGWAISAVGSLDAVTLEGLGRPDIPAMTLTIWGLVAAGIVVATGKWLGVVAVAIGVSTWLSGVGITAIIVCQRLLTSRGANPRHQVRVTGILGVIGTGAASAWFLSSFATTLPRCMSAIVGLAAVTGGLGTWAILERSERALIIGRMRTFLPFLEPFVRRQND